MANENFKRALYDALIPEYTAVMREADDTPHEFSPEFERRMRKLIKRRSKPYYSMINTLGKRVACIIIIIITLSSLTVMSVESWRKTIAKFFINTFETHSDIRYDGDDITAPATIEDIYGITYDLDGYRVDYEEKFDTLYWIIYVKDDITIDFQQQTKNTYNKGINTEGAEITTININNCEAVYFMDNQKYHHLIYDNGYYIIDIMSNVDKSTLINIAESVQKVESE